MADNVKYPMLDDLDLSSPDANHMDWLYYLRGKYRERFEITLFGIPGRSNPEWLTEINNIEWIQVAMHGWNHDEKEEIITEGEIWKAQKLPLIYKGPNWKLPGDTEKNLGSFRIIKKPLPKNYIQGHIWNISDLQNLEEELKKGTTFKLL